MPKQTSTKATKPVAKPKVAKSVAKPKVVETETKTKAVKKVTEVKGEVSPKNKLNALTAKEWIQETISVWQQRGFGDRC